MKRQRKQHANTNASRVGGNGKRPSRAKKHKNLEAEVLHKIHELVSHGQKFQAYSEFMDRADVYLVWPEIREMCAKCAVICLNLRNLLIDEHDRKHG